MLTFDCGIIGYRRELHAAKIIDWLFQQGYVRGRDYSYDWCFSRLTFWAKPGKEQVETLVAMYWIK